MKIDNAGYFSKIENCHRKWEKGFTPYSVVSPSVATACVSLLVLTLLNTVKSYWVAGVLTVLWGVYLFCIFTQEWEPILDKYLSRYQPLDTQAFSDLQSATRAAGKLTKSDLGTWIAAERKAIDSCTPPKEELKVERRVLKFTERDLNSVKREDSA